MMIQGLIGDQQPHEQQLSTHRQQHQTYIQQQRTAHVEQQWRQAPPGYIKCNVDASFYGTAEVTGCGWCARDHRGRFVMAGTNFMQTKLNTLEGEAMANRDIRV
ncbi:hypothetical protein L195_g021511 [Trifolium pratense]|uniref:Cytochrome p450 n=1 Tax=Trifolium pratense TaxID=57577 RepID=A0A2K3N5K5_TRIPR|nr:hypothetical protein L195_g021511 [Trifolium pratense]